MKSIFKRLTIQNPMLSSLVVFNMTVREHRSPRATIDKYFNELVDKGDYLRRDKNDILVHSYSLGSGL